ncbi:MAG: hypothetical protein F6K56_00690 [Moorea sp. SIO3G5]|nr:hypothetical protein [Moorena sp. SIO3G5]
MKYIGDFWKQATGNRQQRIGVSIQPSAISYQRVAYQRFWATDGAT